MVLASGPVAPSAPYVAIPVRTPPTIVLLPITSPIGSCLVDRDLQSRKDTRERAWALDGWSETVSKVRYDLCPSGMIVSGRVVTNCAAARADRRILDAHGRKCSGAAVVQSPQVSMRAMDMSTDWGTSRLS